MNVSGPLGYGDLTRELARRIPLLAKAVADAIRSAGGEDPGPHVVFGDVLMPWLRQELVVRPSGSEIREAFDLLEEMANDPDVRVQEVVQMTVCEDLLATPEMAEAARPLMKSRTLDLADEIGRFWQRMRDASDQ